MVQFGICNDDRIHFNTEDDDWNFACQALKPLAAKWKEVALRLGLAAHQIDEIEGNNPRNTTACLDDALQVWISQNYNTSKFGAPSWRTLCAAIKDLDAKLFKKVATEHKGM